MSIELFAAEKLLEMAFAGIVGNTATDGVRLLWQKIKNRLSRNPSIEAEIIELEQNPTQEKLKLLEAFLQVEMHQDKLFAEEISKLAKEVENMSSGDNIEMKDFEAKDNAVVIGKAEAQIQNFGGTHVHPKKN